MDFMVIDAKYEKDFLLNEDTLSFCKTFKVLAVYAAVQYIHAAEDIKKQLEKEGIKVITSQPNRTDAQFQILGCDNEWKDLKLAEEPDAFLYLGDGKFHPLALALSQKDNKEFKPIIRYDPMANQRIMMGVEEIGRMLKKYRGSMLKFITSDKIGVIITTKPGQQQFRPSKALMGKYPKKTFYYFVENTINFANLEDFNFIDCWVNTACPRIGFDDNPNLPVSMLNLNDALRAEELLSKESALTKA